MEAGITHKPVPRAPRRGMAVREACLNLISNGIRVLPADPFRMAEAMDLRLTPVDGDIMPKAVEEAGPQIGEAEEACTVFDRGRMTYRVIYNRDIESGERIRFSVFHEFGHILLDHFRDWDPDGLTREEKRVLEEEANIYARTLLCPPPVLEQVRGDWKNPRWGRLFCMSQGAWRVRVDTMEVDRKLIDGETAARVRAQFADYMFGRRCRDCGEVFTDPERKGRCPKCGCGFLDWNPLMETRRQAMARPSRRGALAEEIQPEMARSAGTAGAAREPDLTGYWKTLREEERKYGL